MFEVNDKVVYGIVGVCEVEDIAAPPIKGIEGDYYFLQPVYDDKGIIYSPVNSTKVQIRSIISKNECEKIIEKAKNCVKDELLNEKLSPAKYDEIVKSQDIEQLMHLVRHLYNIKNERAKDLRKMKSADSRTLSLARKLLYGEIAAASGKELTEEESCRLLSSVGLCSADYMNRQMDGTLSGGEMKRLEIATVLAKAHKVSIFDEPEAGIDLWSFGRLTETFQQIHRRGTASMIIISHQERIIRLADEVVLISGGRVTGHGPASELLKQIESAGQSGGCADCL